MEALKQIEALIYCQICTQSIKDTSMMCVFCSCIWCKKCIDRWLQVKMAQTCPNCLKRLDENSLVKCTLAQNVNDIISNILKIEQQKNEEVCELHGKLMEYYCQDCDVLSCADCIVLQRKHKEHSVNTASAIGSRCKGEVMEDLDRIERSCIEVQKKAQDIELIKIESEQNLSDIITKMKENLQDKVNFYKEEFCKKFENLDEIKQTIYQKVREAQIERDRIKGKLESLSPIKLIKDKSKMLHKLSKINQKVLSIEELKPIEFEKITFDEEHLKFQSYKFIIPKEKCISEQYTMFDSKFSIKINDDLIGLFKSFDILMESSQYGCMDFEYEIFLIKNNDNDTERAKEHEDRGIIKAEINGRAMVKSAFHVEESLIRNINPVQVKLRVRPKSYSEFCTFQTNKILTLENELNDAKEKISQLNLSLNEESKKEHHSQQLYKNIPNVCQRDLKLIANGQQLFDITQRNKPNPNELWNYREEVIYEIDISLDIELEDNFIMNDCAFRFDIKYGGWGCSKVGPQLAICNNFDDFSNDIQTRPKINFQLFAKVDDENSPDLIIKVFETQNETLIGCVSFIPETIKEIIEEEPETMWVSLFSRRYIDNIYIGCVHEEQLDLPRIKITFESIKSHPSD